MKFKFGKQEEFENFKMSHTSENIETELVDNLVKVLKGYDREYSNIVAFCVGTDRSTGDSLGPLTGTYLKQLGCKLSVYGDMDDPIHAMNLEERIEEVRHNHQKPFIIAIDACLGQVSSVGCIQMANGPLKPGAGVNKELPPVGNIHLTGIVNVGGFMEYFVLQNTRLNLVMNMSMVIAKCLTQAVDIVKNPNVVHFNIE